MGRYFSYCEQGYWATGEYRVWVEAKVTVPYTYMRWIDTSHWETRYRYVDALIPVSFTVIYGTDSYGWSVYSFASRPAGMQQVYYMGSKYLAEKWVIDYRPYRGGSIYAVKYRFMYRFGTQKQSYNVWVSSGYWQSVTAYRIVDNSRWETRTGKYWVDTSYRVESGYWESYVEKEWVDTGHFEYRDEWVTEGHFEEPLHGTIRVVKEPKYIFTRWHKNTDGDQCGMDLKIEWDIYDDETTEAGGSVNEPGNGPEEVNICRVYIFEDVKRYADKGIDKVVIYNGEVDRGPQGSLETFSTFDFAGDEESILNIFLYAEDGRSVHAYFSNPINGYRSINLDYSGTQNDPAGWSGGNNKGEVEF